MLPARACRARMRRNGRTGAVARAECIPQVERQVGMRAREIARGRRTHRVEGARAAALMAPGLLSLAGCDRLLLTVPAALGTAQAEERSDCGAIDDLTIRTALNHIFFSEDTDPPGPCRSRWSEAACCSRAWLRARLPMPVPLSRYRLCTRALCRARCRCPVSARGSASVAVVGACRWALRRRTARGGCDGQTGFQNSCGRADLTLAKAHGMWRYSFPARCAAWRMWRGCA